MFIDAIQVKIRDGQVANRPVYTVSVVTVDGKRDILALDRRATDRSARPRSPSGASRYREAPCDCVPDRRNTS
jgi:hypothetical protein